MRPWQPSLRSPPAVSGIMHSSSVGGGGGCCYVGVCALTALNIYVNMVFSQPSGLRLPLKPKRDLCCDGSSAGLRSQTLSRLCVHGCLQSAPDAASKTSCQSSRASAPTFFPPPGAGAVDVSRGTPLQRWRSSCEHIPASVSNPAAQHKRQEAGKLQRRHIGGRDTVGPRSGCPLKAASISG